MAEVVLETENLTMRFGGVVAADNVNFKLRAGELRCLIGPNGAGKSTFFKCLAGLQTPTEGKVLMRGQDTTKWLPHQIASLGVGVKTQLPNVMDQLTVRENIWMAARRFLSAANSNWKAEELVERLSLGSIVHSELGQLAHGERQRVELAMVVAGDPWLILLDEPAAGMTASDVDIMREIILEMTKSTAVVVVEHDMQFIRSIAETVTVFHQGRILIEDHVDVVLADSTVRDVYLGRKA